MRYCADRYAEVLLSSCQVDGDSAEDRPGLVQFEITADARASLLAWLERRGGSVDDFAFPSRVNSDGHLSTRQYARLVDEWVTAIGLRPEEYGTHASPHESVNHLQGNWQFEGDPDTAGTAGSRTPFGI
jgi:hypothetical protein